MDAALERIILDVLKAKAVEIRDVDGGEEPFLYASGNWGPGYVSIKNLVSRKWLITRLTKALAEKVALAGVRIDFVAGNVTGGMIPGWLLSEELGELLERYIPYVYVREARKKGGQREQITGIYENPEIAPGSRAIVVEELVNFAQTTCNSAETLRAAGFVADWAACILYYDNPEANKALAEHGIKMVYLFTLPELLEVAEKYDSFSKSAIAAYRDFLKDPLGWQDKYRLKPVKEGGTI